MNTAKRELLKILLVVPLLLYAATSTTGANLKFVAIIYDVVTHNPIAGKMVNFQLENIATNQTVYQQTFTTNMNGEVITPSVLLDDSVWHSYSFSITDCQNNNVEFSDTLLATGSDTLFLFLGICHSIVPGNCVAGFTWTTDSLNAFIYSFSNTSTGNPTTFNWNFGDGTTSSLENPVKAYNSPGVYLVCLTISDTATNCQSTKCDVINITQGIVLQTTFVHQLDSFAVTPRLVNFADQSYSNITLNHYIWNFGDGTGALVANPVHQYQQSGQYQVCLISGFMGGLHDTACQQVTVPGYYNLWGQSFAGNAVMESGSVQLINPVYRQTGFRVVDEAPIGTYGFYYFAQRINHDYMLRMFPDPSDPDFYDYLPTYSGNRLYWKDADRVVLDSDVENYDISLIKRKDLAPGIGRIEGSVQLIFGEFIKDALVLLLDNADGKPVTYSFTDSAGGFVLDQLPYGTYRLLAEVPGLESTEIIIDVNPSGTIFTGQTILLSLVTSVAHPENEAIFTISPNPARDHILVTLSENPSEGYFTIFSVDGQLASRHIIKDSGTNQHQIDISNLPQGVYLLEYRSSDSRLVKRFIKSDN